MDEKPEELQNVHLYGIFISRNRLMETKCGTSCYAYALVPLAARNGG